MKVKLFTHGTSRGKIAAQFERLEDDVNAWLEDHPTIEIRHAHALSQPAFGWGQLAVAIWFDER